MPFINLSLLNSQGQMSNAVFEIDPGAATLIETAMQKAEGLMARETLAAIVSALSHAHEIKYLTDKQMLLAMQTDSSRD